MCSSTRGHCSCPGPLSPVPTSRVFRSHTCPWFSLLCKCHVPHPRDTRALNTRVFPVSTPRTVFSQHLLPALLPPRGTGGEGPAAPAPECTARWNGPFSLRSCTLWNIKQFVIEVGGLLLVCIPSGGGGGGGVGAHLSPPAAQLDTTFQVPSCPWGGSDFTPDSSPEPPAICAGITLPAPE